MTPNLREDAPRGHLYMGGMMVGNPPDLLFDCNCPYTGCRVCGAVYQSSLDRTPNASDLVKWLAMAFRKQWSIDHAKKHSEKEHLDLAMSGMWATPEAAQKLASYGIIALSDMIFNPETAEALANARSIPIEDCEGR